MKNNKGINLFIVGMAFSTLGMTFFTDSRFLQYSAMILGLLIMIYSVFVMDKLKKNQTKK